MKYKVGQTITVKLSGGRIVEAEIKAIRETTDGLRFNVSFGSEAAVNYENNIPLSYRGRRPASLFRVQPEVW